MTDVKTKSFSIKIPKMLKTAAPDLLSIAIWALLCFATSRTFFFGKIAPFGVAAVASSKRNCALPAALGAVLGYVFSENPENTLRYERFASGEVLSVLIAGGATAFASFGYAAMTVISGYGSALAFAETALCAGAAYFFKRSGNVFEHGKPLALVSSADRACIIMSAAIIAASFTGLTFGKISLGGIAAAFTVMFAARYGKENGGSVAGVAVGTIASLTAGNFDFGIAGYAAGGLISGIFAVFGKIGTVLSFVAVRFMVCLIISEYPDYIPVYESIIAAGILVLIPEKAGKAVSSFARFSEDTADFATVKELVLSKIGRAADGLLDIATATKKVAESVERENFERPEAILNCPFSSGNVS